MVEQRISFNWSRKYDRMQSAVFSPVSALTKVLFSPRHLNTLPKAINSGLQSFPSSSILLGYMDALVHEKTRGRACAMWTLEASAFQQLCFKLWVLLCKVALGQPPFLTTAGTKGSQTLLPSLDIPQEERRSWSDELQTQKEHLLHEKKKKEKSKKSGTFVVCHIIVFGCKWEPLKLHILASVHAS